MDSTIAYQTICDNMMGVCELELIVSDCRN